MYECDKPPAGGHEIMGVDHPAHSDVLEIRLHDVIGKWWSSLQAHIDEQLIKLHSQI